MARPISILYIHQDGSLTGSATSLRNLLVALDHGKYSPRVLLATEGPARQLYEALGIPVDIIPIKGFWTAPGAPWYRGDYYRNFLALLPNPVLATYLKQINPDLIHINDKAMLCAGIEARRLGFPIVWQLRSSYFSACSRLHVQISRYVIRWAADKLIAISKDEVDGFDDLLKLEIIHNSVDLTQSNYARTRREEVRAELGIMPNQILVGTVSTYISEIRGTWDFLRAASAAKLLTPELDLHFIVVAKIPDRTQEKRGFQARLGPIDDMHPEDKAWQLAHDGDIDSQLTLTGYRKDALDIMSAMDIVVVCNRHGVLGRMPFEAMSVGRPLVVTSGHSGRSQVVRHGETGFVVSSGDQKILANAIVHLARDLDLRQKMGQRGIDYSRQHFDSEKNARSVEQVYQKLLLGLKLSEKNKRHDY